jgi:hypothetical protein
MGGMSDAGIEQSMGVGVTAGCMKGKRLLGK